MAGFYEMSACGTSAGSFFEELRRQRTDLLLDVRLRNESTLCGFTRGRDLSYLTPRLTGASYVHDIRFAPDPGLLEDYLSYRITWEEYEERYLERMKTQDAAALFRSEYGDYSAVCILGAANKTRKSHSGTLLRLLDNQQ